MSPVPDEQVTQEQYIERWEQALRVLESMSEHERTQHFDMGDWGVKTDCGTVACLAGHCSLDPWFVERGFSAKFRKDRHYKTGEELVVLEFDQLEPHKFFGDVGEDRVFLQTTASFEKTVTNVRKHIEYLKAGFSPDEDNSDEDDDE